MAVLRKPSTVEDCFFRHGFAPRLTDTQQAMVRSQSGPMAGVPLLAFPHITFVQVRRVCVSCAPPPPPLAPPSVFVRLPVWPSTRRLWPSVGLRGFRGVGWGLCSGECSGSSLSGSRWARSLNVRVSDLDLPLLGAQDQRRLEVVADGLPLFHGALLAIDTTWCSL